MPLAYDWIERWPRSGRRCVAVAGTARSGTSWLAKTLSLATGYSYYREPDNHHGVPGAEERFAWDYYTPQHCDPAYLALMDRVFAGEIATAHTMSADPGPLLRRFGLRGLQLGERHPLLFCRKRHVLVKLIYATLNLTYLAARYPAAKQLWVVRHPCGQFESWRRLEWQPTPARLLENERLMADHLHPFESYLAGAKTFWERAGAYWAAMAYVVHRQTDATSGRLIVAYEWVCADPLARFRELYRRLDLPWNRKVKRFLRSSDAPEDDDPYSLRRRTRLEIDKWRERVSPMDAASCRRFVEPFELPYYPGFEPHVTTMRGDRTV